MSRNGRFGLLAVAAVIAVFVFVLARPESGSEKADDPTPVTESTPSDAAGGPTATAESALPPPPTEVVLRDHEAVGGVESVEVSKGDEVRLVVSSDAADEIHLHGYDLTREVAPGRPARFRVTADLEGVFEIESHEAEQAGKPALVARLVVEPG